MRTAYPTYDRAIMHARRNTSLIRPSGRLCAGVERECRRKAERAAEPVLLDG
jgi:hypothetical protein